MTVEEILEVLKNLKSRYTNISIDILSDWVQDDPEMLKVLNTSIYLAACGEIKYVSESVHEEQTKKKMIRNPEIFRKYQYHYLYIPREGNVRLSQREIGGDKMPEKYSKGGFSASYIYCGQKDHTIHLICNYFRGLDTPFYGRHLSFDGLYMSLKSLIKE